MSMRFIRAHASGAGRDPLRLLMLRAAIMLATAMLAAMCAAQDAGSEEEPEEEEAKEAAPRIVQLELGAGGWRTSGNAAKLRQYASPAGGVYVRELTLQPAGFPYDGYALLRLSGVGSDDAANGLELGFNGDRTRIWYHGARNRFYEHTSLVIPESNRKTEGITVRLLPHPDFGLTWSYSVDNQDHYFEAPREATRRRIRQWEMSANGKVGDGNLGVTVSDFRFYDRMLTLPDTSVQSWSVNGLWSQSPEADLYGSVTGRTIERSGAGVGRVNEIAAGGTLDMGALGDLSVRGETQHMNWPGMESSYVTDRRMAETMLVSRLGSMGMRLKWQYHEAERVRAGGDYLDVPKWTVVSGRMAGRIGKLLRLTLKGSSERMWQRPQMVMTDTRSALWDARDGLEIKLDGSGESLQGYAAWKFQRRGNTPRGTNVTCGTATAGLTVTLAPNLEMFGEVAYETWRGRSEAVAYPTLGNFMPDSRMTALGLSYALTQSTFFWAGYTDTATNNDNPLLLRDGNTRSHYLTLMVRHRFASGEEVSLSVAPWTYRDEVDPTMNLTATTVVMSARGRF